MLKKLTITILALVMICTAMLPAMGVSAHTEETVTNEFSTLPAGELRSENWVIDSSNPQFFSGDADRMVRTSTDTGYAVYQMTGVQSFSLQTYYFSGSTAVVKFYGSADAADWTELPAVNDSPAATASGWYGTMYTPSGALPDSVNYLKIEVSGDLDTWMTQLGSLKLSNVSIAPLTVNDELDDVSQLSAYSDNWTMDTSNPDYFGGDASRAVRTAESAEFIVYHLHNLQSFKARLHSFAGSSGSIRFYGSADASAWAELPAVQDAPQSTGDGAWTGSNYTPAEVIPPGIHYLKIELSGDSAPWQMQLGSVSLSNRTQGGGGSSGGDGDYYVDALTGSDSNDGRTPETAWKTFSVVNQTTFEAGDRILLKKGGIWNEQLYPKGSGTDEKLITIGAYGTGSKPVINGGGMAGGAVYLRNASNWMIRDLEVTNYASERGTVYREGIMVENANGGILRNIHIKDNYVHDVSSSFRYPTVSGAEGGPHAFGGISVYVGGTTGTDKFDGVWIEGNTVERIGRTGIVVWDQRFNGTDYATVNVTIRGNYVKQADSDGILTFGVNGGLIEHNIAEEGGNYSEEGEFNGSAAIWPTRGRNNVVQFNESFNTNKPEGDGQGFNLDIDTIDSVVQYNYSHGNKGGFMLFVDARLTPGVLTGSSNNVVRYNISQNDLTHTFNFAGGVTPDTQIYNNTIYIGAGQNTRIIDHEWDDGGNINAPYSFKNNLVYNLGQGGYNLPGVNGTFDHNLLYGNHPASEPENANSITANPLLVAQGSGGTGWNTVDGYKLRDNSPALGAGAVIADNGGLDYWGNAVSADAPPNIGAYNGPGLDPATLPEAPVDDLRLYYEGLKIVPHIKDGSSGDLSLQLQFTNSSTADPLVIKKITWTVGEGKDQISGSESQLSGIAPGNKFPYSIPLPGFAEGVKYPLELTVDLEGYEDVHIKRNIDINRMPNQSDTSSPALIDLADGTPLLTGYNGVDDISGTAQLRWDKDQLYLTADIRDDVFTHKASGINIWQNDSIQFSLAPGVPGDSQSWYEYGISQTPEGPQIYRWLSMKGAATGVLTTGTLKVTRDEQNKVTSYALALPWSEVSPVRPAAGEVLSFSMLVNDNDGAGRKGYIEWGSGIGGVKDPTLFRTFQLMNTGKGEEPELSSNAALSRLSIDGTDISGFGQDKLDYTINLPFSKTEVIVTGTPAHAGATVTVTGGSGLKVGDNRIDVKVTAADGATSKTYTVHVVRSGDNAGTDTPEPTPGSNNGNNNNNNNSGGSEGTPGTVGGEIITHSPGLLQVQAEPGADGISHAQLRDGEIRQAMDGVQSGALVLKLAAENAMFKGSAFQLPVKELKDHVTSLTVQAGGVTLTIPVASLMDSIPEDSRQLELSVHIADASQQPAAMIKKWTTYSMHRISLAVDGQQIERLSRSASMKVSIAHNLKPGEAQHQAIAYSITGGGQTEVVKHSKYVSGAGSVTFTTQNFGLYGTANADVHFSDTDSSNSIILEALAARDLVRGTGEGKYEPDRQITRAEFIQLLVSALELQGGNNQGIFKDVTPGAWYYQAVMTAQAAGVVNGRSESFFGAMEPVTRQEIAVMLFRAMRLNGPQPETSGPAAAFTDHKQIGAYALEPVNYLRQTGIINGYGDGTYKPQGLTTREEAAAVIYRIMGL
ncbi:S-layer homology domain-containing protein [Paenibacillus sp. FSL R7-0302]|uniref:S-layer homology domain-containing protein n=1 Tax=Paenibacillus sp. FSL R7-0302 TaxID=2921681 RepID=UPI0030F569D4